MFKRNNISVALAATTLVFMANASAETVTSTATVTVQNAFTLAEVTPIDFGTLRVTQAAAQATATPAYITLPIDGSAMVPTDGNNGGSMTAIVDGAVAEYSITGAAPFTDLTVDVATEPDQLTVNTAGSIVGMNGQTLVTAGGAADQFFTLYTDVTQTVIVGGANDGDELDATASNLRTDTNGEVGFQVGGVLAFNPAATSSPNDGVYTGSYTIEVNY